MAIDYAALKKGGFMRQKQKGRFSLRLQVVGGRLTAENLEIIRKVAKQYGDGYVHLTSRQGVEIPFVRYEDIEEIREELAKGGCRPGVCGPRVRTVTACQGNAVCPSGNIDAYRIAQELDRRYYARELPHKFKFGVTGCQNNCLKAEENDLGVKGALDVSWHEEKCTSCGVCVTACRAGAIEISGDKLSVDRTKCNNCGRCVQACPFDAWTGESAYQVSFGGLFGNTVAQGESLLPLICTEEQLYAVCDAAIQFFGDHAEPGERFRFTLDRVGWDKFQKVIREAYDGADRVKSDKTVDITDAVCPMTFVRTKAALDTIEVGQVLAVIMNGGEPAQNVPRSMKDEGQQVLKLEKLENGTYKMYVKKLED